MSDRRYSDRTIYRRVLREARPYWPHIGVLFVVSLLATPLALLAPVPLKIAVDNVVGDKPVPDWLEAILPASITSSDTALLTFTATFLVVIALLVQLQILATSILRTYTGERLTFGFRNRLFRHLQRLSLGYHDTKGTSDSTYRVQYDATSAQTIAVDGVIPFISSLVMVGAMLYVTARISPALAAVALVVTPVILLLTLYYRTRLRARHREVKRLESSAMSVVQEVLSSVRVVKAFGQEDREESRFAGQAGQGMRARIRITAVEGGFWLLLDLVIAVGTAAVLYIGVRGVQTGSITLGSLLLVMGYLAQLYGPLSTVSRRVTGLQAAFASAERAFTVLDEAPDVPERADALPIERAVGSVEFRDVWFGYSADRPVLKEVSFRVQAGDRVGIAGHTGAGKTTLANLVTRFYDPSVGAVLLDGVDMREYKVADLRNQFAIVLQDPVLFSTTIAENIAYARPEATVEEIVEAADAANVHEFIDSLPDGYDTVVGERGMTLSGGERQRISLARAFLKDAPILILDEPTSSVDVKTEAVIVDAMNRLMAGRTAFMIAHRLSTLDMCNVRLELDGGAVVASKPKAPVATRPRRTRASGPTVGRATG